MPSPADPVDRDLVSIGEARSAARRARAAQARLEELTQEQIDTIVSAMAKAATGAAQALATAAVEETGYGIVADKVRKNLFSSQQVHDFIRPMKTVGVVRVLDDRRVVEIAQPFGVVAAVIPCTNPTSTAIYKVLIAIKARCAIVLSPHPKAVGCILQSAEVMSRAATAAGAPDGAIGWLQTVSIEGTQALMAHPDVSVILATGGMELVRAAYSAGKPAYGVGPGNAPAYIERSADVEQAVEAVIAGKTFDNGVLCSAENSVVVDRSIAGDVRRAFAACGGKFLSADERDALARVLVTRRQLPNPELVGQSATAVAERAGIEVPPDTRVLLVDLEGVGPDHPLSIEKLCPVLSFYEVDDWREGCQRCIEILEHGGMGHTMAIHSNDEAVIREFGLKKPASRIVVNTPTTHGSIGLTTGLDPAMTLGCGGYGGNITSDNISPLHLLTIKRLAYGTRPWNETQTPRPVEPPAATAPRRGIDADSLAQRIDAFLRQRGVTASPAGTAAQRSTTAPATQPQGGQPQPPTESADSPSESLRVTAEFVCEEDVREAIRDQRPIVIDERTIVTPAARDLATGRDVLVTSGVSRTGSH